MSMVLYIIGTLMCLYSIYVGIKSSKAKDSE